MKRFKLVAIKTPIKIIGIFVFCVLLSAINSCALLEEEEDWVDFSSEECRASYKTSYAIPNVDGLELINCRQTLSEYKTYVYFTLPDTLAPIDWLIFLTERHERTLRDWHFTKTSDYSYCLYGGSETNSDICYVQYQYYEDEKYYHKYIYNPS